MLVEDLELFYLPSEKKIPTENKNIEALKYRADQEKDLSKKMMLFKQLWDFNPDDEEINLRLAGLYESTGNYLKAIEHYKYILASKYHGYGISPPVPALIGQLYSKTGENDLAITYFTQAIKDSPNNPSLYNEIADLYLANYDTLRAVQNLNKSINLQPLQKDPYLSLFFLHLNYEDFEVANKIISNSYNINLNDFGTLYCYSLAQKYISKIPLSDSVLYSIEQNSGIKKRLSEVTDFNSNGDYYYYGRQLTQQERRLQIIQDAITDYPYYDGFYKIYIQFVVDNKINKDIKLYKKKYLFYSKLNPDYTFINKYVK
ncbi:MAG: tetratricopeptide repeat protein [Bacteroidales bacterium]